MSTIEQGDRSAFGEIERVPFGFHHHLGRSPLLELDALRTLAAFFESRGIPAHYECGKKGLAQGWGERPSGLSLLDAFDRLADGETLIILNSAHAHLDYAALLDAFISDLGSVLDVDMARKYRAPICTVIIASPHRITPYHMDNSHNLLMQVHGAKQFHVFDGSDPGIVTPLELEAFWRGDRNAAILTEDRRRRATVYELGPGLGVHVPMTYPHWAKNGAEISVAVSVNFAPMHNGDAHVYAVNAMLRRFGLKPRGPGQSPLADRSKAVAFRSLKALKTATQLRARNASRVKAHSG